MVSSPPVSDMDEDILSNHNVCIIGVADLACILEKLPKGARGRNNDLLENSILHAIHEKQIKRTVGWFAADLDAEIKRAKAKHPTNEAMTAALSEECGEVARALVDESKERVYEECVQVACVAYRITEGGDASLEDYRKKKGLD